MSYSSRLKASPEQWTRLQSANASILKRFFSNVDMLGVARYGSRNKAIIALRERTGWTTTSQTVKAFKVGEFTKAELTGLNAWSLLLGEPLERLLSEDYSLRSGS